MDRTDLKVLSFIVKLWLEESGDETEMTRWHGFITHVPGSERRHLKKLDDIKDFIEPYLGQPEVKREGWFRLKGWLKRLKLGRRK